MINTGSNAFKELVLSILPMSVAAPWKYQYDNFQGLVDGVRVWEAIDVTVHRVHLDGINASAQVSFKTNKGEFSFEYSFEPNQCTVIKEEITLPFLTAVAALKQLSRFLREGISGSYRTPADNPTQFAKDFAELHELSSNHHPYTFSNARNASNDWLIVISTNDGPFFSRSPFLNVAFRNAIEYLKTNPGTEEVK